MNQLVKGSKKLPYVIVLIGSCASIPAVQADEFPWLMTAYHYADLSEEQEAIYRDSYLETMGFLLYGYVDPRNPEAARALNGLIDCTEQTRQKNSWTNYFSWFVGKHGEKAGAWLLYNEVTPTVCSDYFEKAGTQPRVLQVRSHKEWKSWSQADRSVYVQGYLDTVAAMQFRLEAQGQPNDLDLIAQLITTVGIEGILRDVEGIEFESEYPLPWSISRGLGRAKDRMQQASGP
ncbi:hypothetical protein [Thioalkalivibrio sp. XN8]|uniref:hypothetical protein n=1 Tax=Thioalkalivibrio sp. XN8 TaxID=2712863 RepID=UPI0013EDBE09|nr:hypothetical protein [Thioalkalivibrio sp. XN8]NGP53577.1 hypothetical protein [Thioalkalivibrio sp. XN8]